MSNAGIVCSSTETAQKRNDAIDTLVRCTPEELAAVGLTYNAVEAKKTLITTGPPEELWPVIEADVKKLVDHAIKEGDDLETPGWSKAVLGDRLHVLLQTESAKSVSKDKIQHELDPQAELDSAPLRNKKSSKKVNKPPRRAERAKKALEQGRILTVDENA